MKNLKLYWLILLITFAFSFALPANAQTKKPRKKAKVVKKKVVSKTAAQKMAAKIETENSTPGKVFDGPVRDATASDEPPPQETVKTGNIGPFSAKGLPKLSDGSYSTGVLNAKATSLPKPPYPAAAKAVKASGSVVIQVLIDEEGNVILANATSGHPLLRAASVQAARSAKFAPTLLDGNKVKITGLIVYNFTLN